MKNLITTSLLLFATTSASAGTVTVSATQGGRIDMGPYLIDSVKISTSSEPGYSIDSTIVIKDVQGVAPACLIPLRLLKELNIDSTSLMSLAMNENTEIHCTVRNAISPIANSLTVKINRDKN